MTPETPKGHLCPRTGSVRCFLASCRDCRRFTLAGHEVIANPSYIFNETIKIRGIKRGFCDA